MNIRTVLNRISSYFTEKPTSDKEKFTAQKTEQIIEKI